MPCPAMSQASPASVPGDWVWSETSAIIYAHASVNSRLTKPLRPRVHWSQNRHDTTQQSGQTPVKTVINNINIYVSRYAETDPTGMLSNNCPQSGPTKWVCFEPTVQPDTCCSLPRVHWSQNRHNAAVWTDFRQSSSNQPHYCLSAATLKPIRLECCLPTTAYSLAQQSGFVSSRQSGQTPAAVCIRFECCCNGQNVSNRTC